MVVLSQIRARRLRLTVIGLMIAWPCVLMLSKADLSLQRWASSILGLLSVTTGAISSVLLVLARRHTGKGIGLAVQFGGLQVAAGLSIISWSLKLHTAAAMFGVATIGFWLAGSALRFREGHGSGTPRP